MGFTLQLSLPAQMLMIAAHGWDIAGAAHAGLATGFITREGQAIYPSIAHFIATDILTWQNNWLLPATPIPKTLKANYIILGVTR
jgi:hypothetical protein